MMNATTIGNKIAQARKMKNLSQTQLSEVLAVSSQAVSKWERGDSMPDILTFNRLAEVLGVDLNYFSDTFPAAGAAEETPRAAADRMKSRAWDMLASNWKDADFSGLAGLKERFSSANITNCLFVESDLAGLTLKSNNVLGCDFTGASLRGSRFGSSNFRHDTFRGSDLSETQVSSTNFSDCDFTGADLTAVMMKSSTFSGGDLAGALLRKTEFDRCQFTGLVLSGQIEDGSFVECDFKNVEFRNATLTNTFFKGRGIRRLRFADSRADKITYAFLKNGNADLTGLTVAEG